MKRRTYRFVSIFMLAAFVALQPNAGVGQDGVLVDSQSVALPDRVVERLRASQPSMRSVLSDVEIRVITYLSNGLRIRGYVARPRSSNGQLPGVIFNRGGNREFGALDDESAAAVLAPLAAQGYVVAASQYRGGPGSEGQDEFGGRDVADVINMLAVLKNDEGVDQSRIAMLGYSRGGLMTYRALAHGDRIAAAVVIAGIADLFDVVKRRPALEYDVIGKLVPDYWLRRQQALRERSAVKWVESLPHSTPLLLIHGTDDERVHVSQSLHVAVHLHRAGRPFHLALLQGADHDLSGHEAQAGQLVSAWLDLYLRGSAMSLR